MAYLEQVTRTFTGKHREDGSAVYETVRHGQARPPESVADWVQLRVAALSGTSGAAARVTVRLLLAGDAAAVKAAAAEGKTLSEIQRWGVLQALEQLHKLAREQYGPAAGLMSERVAAWKAAHGSKQPRDRAA